MGGYCVKCREKVEINNGTTKTSKNCRKMVSGHCPHCNTKLKRFVAA